MGGSRLCILPFGFYSRMLMDLAEDPEMASVVFFDNNFEKLKEEGYPVNDPKQITEDDYVVILSQSYSSEIREQIIRIRGKQPQRTLGYDALLAGHGTFSGNAGPTEVEKWLTKHEFTVLANHVRELRIAQTRRYGKG